MRTISVPELRVMPPGEHLPPPIHQGQQRVYVQAAGYIFELELATQHPIQAASTGPFGCRILFGAIPGPRLRVRKPIPVDIATVEGTFVASSPELEEFGYGQTRSEALDDLGRTLSELYFSLADQQPRLSEHLKDIQAKLSEYVELRPGR